MEKYIDEIVKLLPRMNNAYYRRQLKRMSSDTLVILASEIKKAIEQAKRDAVSRDEQVEARG